MDKISGVLQKVEKSITKDEERFYFWTHEVRYHVILSHIQKLASGQKLTILDIGCFPYHIGRALELLNHDVYGISSYHEPIKNKNIEVINIEKEKFPYKNNFFDMVLCNEVIEHLPQSPLMPLSEMFRVLKKGGYCMVTTPSITRSINRAKLLLGKNIMYPTSVFYENNGEGNNIYHRHNREYTLGELEELFTKSSFLIAQKKYFISYTPFRKRAISDSLLFKLGKFANYLLMEAIPPLRDTLFVMGKK